MLRLASPCTLLPPPPVNERLALGHFGGAGGGGFGGARVRVTCDGATALWHVLIGDDHHRQDVAMAVDGAPAVALTATASTSSGAVEDALSGGDSAGVGRRPSSFSVTTQLSGAAGDGTDAVAAERGLVFTRVTQLLCTRWQLSPGAVAFAAPRAQFAGGGDGGDALSAAAATAAVGSPALWSLLVGSVLPALSPTDISAPLRALLLATAGVSTTEAATASANSSSTSPLSMAHAPSLVAAPQPTAPWSRAASAAAAATAAAAADAAARSPLPVVEGSYEKAAVIDSFVALAVGNAPSDSGLFPPLDRSFASKPLGTRRPRNTRLRLRRRRLARHQPPQP